MTTKTKIKTVVRFETNRGEMIFHYGRATPEALRYQLSPVLLVIRLAEQARLARLEAIDPATQLARLAELRERGFLSEEEFADAKRKLLDRM